MATTRIVTLNEVLNLCENFVSSHPMISDFGYGPTSEIGTSRQMKFPYIWATHQTDSYIRVANKTAIPELNLMFLFMDQINNQNNTDDNVGEGSDNGTDIMSDMFQLLQDFVIEIETNWGQYGIMITEDVRALATFDETTDKVNGWAGEFSLKLSYTNCEIPI